MAKDSKKELLFQAIRNNESDIVKKLIDEDGVEFENLGEDVFDMSKDCTALGYVPDTQMMHYFLDKGIKPTLNDITAISFGSVDNISKIDVLDYYLNNFKDVASQDIVQKDLWDTRGSNYQVAKYLNKEQPLLTMMFFDAIRNANKNLYNYLKPKLKEIDLNSPIPIRYEKFDEDVSKERYYITEDITKRLSRKTQDNEKFMKELEGKSKKAKEEAIDYVAVENKKYLEWLEFLLDEGVSPFNSTLASNFYYETYPFSILVLNRETNLVKKSIEKFPTDWDKFKNDVDLLDDILAYNKESSNYYQREKDPEVYIYPYRATQRDEIIEYLAQNGFPFYKHYSFVTALQGRVFYKNDYTKYDFDIDNKLFWDILEKYTPQGDGSKTISSNSFTDEENERLEKKGYAISKDEQLLRLIDSLKKYRSDEDEIVQKAQRLIDKGAKFENGMDILFKFSDYAIAHNYIYSDDYTKIVELVVNNDMVSKEEFKGWFENESLDRWDKEKFFEHYKDAKEPLYTKYKDVIFGFDFETQLLYITLASNSKDEAYEFFVKNKDKFEPSYYDNGNLNTMSNSPLYSLRTKKNWEVLRGYIKFVDENYPIKENSLSFSDIESMIDKAPEDILTWYQNYVDVDDMKNIKYETFESLVYNNLEVILDKFRDKPAILNVSNKYSKTLLHNACDVKNIGKIQKLLDLGLSVKVKDKYGKTPFDCFLKAKPDVENEEHFEMFKKLLTKLLKEGDKPSVDAIKSIKPKKYKAYQDLLNDYSEITDEIDKEDELEDVKQDAYDNELVDVTIYRTEVTTHYHRYATTVKVPRKDLVLDDNDLVNDYYDYDSEEYQSDWDSSPDNEWEIVK